MGHINMDYQQWEDGFDRATLVRSYALLTLTTCLEGTATMLLKIASMKGLWWLFFAYCFYGGAFAVFPEVLKVIRVGEAYAIWSGAGCVLTAIGGCVFFGEHLTNVNMASMALVLIGICGLISSK